MRVSIRIEVDYDESTVDSVKDLRRDLHRNIESAVGLGLLNNANEEAVVDEWFASVDGEGAL